ncbi:hypothetical protein J2128_001230 [Methanomicrobium sp. W14]|uniref:hypothetical protein n=1 Tax=Methanomicrobium sp. W14 TaxID=2817839 RepID=UPI001AE9E26B|nr:hypothetical protein [Methanomicrobium sp. W14]MBP2133276.1 hypothetical protein [Methanomicrobium sp. W14]
MKNTYLAAAVLVLLALCFLAAAAVLCSSGESTVTTGGELSDNGQSVKNILDLSDSAITEWSGLPRDNWSSEFQEYIDLDNTTYELRNYENGIISLNDFLNPVISFFDENPLKADEIYICREEYNAYFDFKNENNESAGDAKYECLSPQECYKVTAFMAENQELKQIFGATGCIPEYEEYYFLCYIKCKYESGEEAYVVFSNHQAVFYYNYQNDEIISMFDDWFDKIPEYH